MWRDYLTAEAVAKRIPGIKAKDSIEAAKHDGGCGVVVHPVTGRSIYWD